MQPFGRTGQGAQYSAVTGTSEADARVRAAVPKAAPDARGRPAVMLLSMASHGAGAESIEHMGLVEPLDVSAQLDDLRRLKDGWLDGHGTAPASGGLDWLDRAFNRHYPDDLPLPHLYPTAPGGVQAEWTLGPNEITLEVDLDRRSGYFHVLHVEDDADEERNIELGDESGWRELAGLISSMSEDGR